MKLAVYKDNLSTGRGADRAVKNFAAGLAARGHSVALFEKNELPARLDESWDVFIATGSNEIVDLARTGYFSRAGRAPVALQLHLAPSGFFKWRHPFRNREIRRAFNLPDAVQLLCKSYEAEFSRLAPRPQVVTIGNYTEIAAPPEPKGAAPSTTILYPAAALTKVKNQKFLITAFAKLAARFMNITEFRIFSYPSPVSLQTSLRNIRARHSSRSRPLSRDFPSPSWRPQNSRSQPSRSTTFPARRTSSRTITQG